MAVKTKRAEGGECNRVRVGVNSCVCVCMCVEAVVSIGVCPLATSFSISESISWIPRATLRAIDIVRDRFTVNDAVPGHTRVHGMSHGQTTTSRVYFDG